jgi:hypothetical protein
VSPSLSEVLTELPKERFASNSHQKEAVVAALALEQQVDCHAELALIGYQNRRMFCDVIHMFGLQHERNIEPGGA